MRFVNQDPDRLLTRDEAAKYLGVQPQTLRIWGCLKRYNLKYIKVGALVKYRKGDLDEFLSQRTVSNS